MHRKPIPEAGRQARKTQRTRARLIDATLAIILEQGLSAATAQRHRATCRRHLGRGAASVRLQGRTSSRPSWRRRMRATSTSCANRRCAAWSRAARARRFVHACGRTTRATTIGSHWRSAATRGRGAAGRVAWEQRQGRAHCGWCVRYSSDTHLSDARLREALTFTHCCLTGLAIERLFERRVRHIERHLGHISRCSRCWPHASLRPDAQPTAAASLQLANRARRRAAGRLQARASGSRKMHRP